MAGGGRVEKEGKGERGSEERGRKEKEGKGEKMEEEEKVTEREGVSLPKFLLTHTTVLRRFKSTSPVSL